MGKGGEGRLFQMWGPKCERRWGVGGGGGDYSRCGGQSVRNGGGGGGIVPDVRASSV